MSKTVKYIDDRKRYWGPEFADMLKVDYVSSFDEIAAIGAYTMLYEIADRFMDGVYREEILNMYGVTLDL